MFQFYIQVSVVFPPKPIGPIPNLFAVVTISSSRSASSLIEFLSSNFLSKLFFRFHIVQNLYLHPIQTPSTPGPHPLP